MTYSISRNYRTDFSRTNAHAILNNMAHDLADAKGISIPTKNVFQLPEVQDEDANRFSFELLPTVVEAGIAPEDIVPSEVARDGRHYVRLHGMTDTEAHVTVRKAAENETNFYGPTDFDQYIEMWQRITAEKADSDEDDEDDEPEIRTDGGVVSTAADADSDSDSEEDVDAEDPTKPSQDQAIEAAEASDRQHILNALPEDIHSKLTKRAFSPGSMRKLLMDTYYAGPIGIGTGGWLGMFGGAPGTEMRRPHGALYNFPRSWRYAALQRALNTGLITHVGSGKFAATARGVALLDVVDRCPEHGVRRKPMKKTSGYKSSPMAPAIVSHRLVTVCPECGTSGYGGRGSNSFSSYKDLKRGEAAVNNAKKMAEHHPEARIYTNEDEPEGADVDVDLSEVPDVDEQATEELLDEVVENHVAGTPAELFAAYDEDRAGRQVITIPSEGDHYRFAGFEDSVAVSRRDAKGDVHFTVSEDGERLIAKMSYETATAGAKENVKIFVGTVKKYEWDNANKQWLIDPDVLPLAVSYLTHEVINENTNEVAVPDFEVTVDPACLSLLTVPMLGIDTDGNLI